MFKKSLIALWVSLFLISCSSNTSKTSGPNLKEGKWEITITMEAKGQMPFKMPPQTFTQCITKEKVIPVSAENETNQNCKFIRNTITGDTVSWTMECKTPDGSVINEGTITYKGDNFEGFSKVKHSSTEFTQKMIGKWGGECK